MDSELTIKRNRQVCISLTGVPPCIVRNIRTDRSRRSIIVTTCLMLFVKNAKSGAAYSVERVVVTLVVPLVLRAVSRVDTALEPTTMVSVTPPTDAMLYRSTVLMLLRLVLHTKVPGKLTGPIRNSTVTQ